MDLTKGPILRKNRIFMNYCKNDVANFLDHKFKKNAQYKKVKSFTINLDVLVALFLKQKKSEAILPIFIFLRFTAAAAHETCNQFFRNTLASLVIQTFNSELPRFDH